MVHVKGSDEILDSSVKSVGVGEAPMSKRKSLVYSPRRSNAPRTNDGVIKGFVDAIEQYKGQADASQDAMRFMAEDFKELLEELPNKNNNKSVDEDCQSSNDSNITQYDDYSYHNSFDKVSRSSVELRNRLRDHANRLMGNAKREQILMNSRSFHVNASGLSKEHPNDWADIAQSIFEEELLRYEPKMDFWSRFLHDYRHNGYRTFGATLYHHIPIVIAVLTAIISIVVVLPYKTLFAVGIMLVTFAIGCIFLLLITKNTGLKSTPQEFVHDSCCLGVELNPIHDRATVNRSNEQHRCTVRMFPVGITFGIDRIIKFRSCTHNEQIALYNRQLLPFPYDEDTLIERWRAVGELFKKTDFFHECPDFPDFNEDQIDKFLARYPLGRRTSLKQTLLNGDLVNVDSGSRGFVKADEWNVCKSLNKLAPRYISSSSDERLLCVSDFWAWNKLILPVVQDVTKRFTVASGLNATEVSNWVDFYSNKGWYFYEGDFSRFDGRTCMGALLAKLDFYKSKHMRDHLIELFKAKLKCNGVTKSGIKYTCPGKICSGEIDTSFGDSLLNMMIFNYVLRDIKYNWALIVNGDDNILATEEAADVHAIIVACERLGHILELIERPDLDYLEFCSARFWDIGNGRRMLGPKLGRFYAKALMPKSAISPKSLPIHIRKVLESYYYYRWLPGFSTILAQHNISKYNASTESEYKNHLREHLDVDVSAVQAHFVKIYAQDIIAYEKLIQQVDWRKPGMTYRHHIIDSLLQADGVYDDSQDVISNLPLTSIYIEG